MKKEGYKFIKKSGAYNINDIEGKTCYVIEYKPGPYKFDSSTGWEK
jgi:hypothetical protein